jgi:hypothetical protein
MPEDRAAKTGNPPDESYEDRLEEALSQPFRGWDFSWVDRRAPIVEELPWRFSEVVSESVAGRKRMLDMGTGGGEELLRIPRRPAITIADEAFPPNVAVAAANLRPHGIPVVQVEAAPDNDSQDGVRGRLPFADEVFDLVVNRHESFLATEVLRILAPGDRFVTQQVDRHWYKGFCAALGLDVPDLPESWLPLAVDQLQRAGFKIAVARRGDELQAFHDVGTLVWYLRAVSFDIPGLSPFDPATRPRFAAPMIRCTRRPSSSDTRGSCWSPNAHSAWGQKSIR